MKRNAPFYAFVSALALVFLAYVLLFANVKMESTAMEPAIAAGDYLLVWRDAYGLRLPLVGEVVRLGRPSRGDIVLVEKELKDDDGNGNDRGRPIVAVLRVVGLPGEVVSITDKRVWIDGQQLPETYTSFADDRVYPEGLSARDNMAAVVVPEDGYFMMGDRRDSTTDSRFFGCVERSDIRGKVVLIYW
jgi:signal peptidase I